MTETYVYNRTPSVEDGRERARVGRIVYYMLGVIEILLGFRLIFKLLGANPLSPFVTVIYSITNVLQAPFAGIFRRATNPGVETVSVFEPATIIAGIAYALLAVGIVKLLVVSSRRPAQVEREL